MQDKLKIIRANVKDITELIKIVGGVKSIEDYPGEYNRAYFEKMLKRNIVLLAQLDKKIVGFIEFELDKWAKRVFLESIAVSKKFRGQGIGLRLLDELELFAKKHKAKRISMLVRGWNTAMNSMAKKNKFVKLDKLYLWDKMLK